jgi:hydrogenase nickel incorporation protein HypB
MKIEIIKDVMEKNKKVAHKVRERLAEHKVKMVNLMSAPGSGKTTLLEKWVPRIIDSGIRCALLEGDVATMNDGERLSVLGVPVCHISTKDCGGSCHIAANVALAALDRLDLEALDLILLENVGNLICTAEYDTGADLNVVVLSITEGEDKPLKYPRMFQVSKVALLNKMDIAEVLETDIALIRKNILSIQPEAKILEISARKENGLDDLHSSIMAELGFVSGS